jgi:anti-sigma factor RsiW
VISCPDIRRELGGYVLGGLEAEEQAAVEAHTASCDRCRADLDELARTVELLATLPRPPARRAPEDLKQRVLGRSRHRRSAPLLVAAAMTLALLAGIGMANLLHRPPPADAEVTLREVAPVGIVGEAALRQVTNGVRVDLDLAGVRSPDEGYYHVWLQRGDRRVSAGTFIGAADASAKLQLLCGGQLDDYDRLSVTWHAFDERDEVVALDADIVHRP